MNPEAEYWEVCYSGTPGQRQNYVHPATGCGATLNPSYVEPQPDREFVECVFAGVSWTGRARYSDGTYECHPACNARRLQQLTENLYRYMDSDARIPDPSQGSAGSIYETATEESILGQETPPRESEEGFQAGVLTKSAASSP